MQGIADKKVYQFYIDSHEILCSKHRECLTVECFLGDLPEGDVEAGQILEKLLKLSLCNSNEFGFVLSMDDNEKLVLSNRQTLENYSLTKFEESLEMLLFQIESYEKIMQETNDSSNFMFGMMPVV